MAVINQQEPLRTVKGVQLFLNFYNFYQYFIKNYSRVARPLTYLTKKDQPFHFNTVCKQAFNKLKKRLISALLFAYFHLEQPLMLKTNTLDGVIASIYSQKQLDGEWYSITYYLKTMVDAELNYPIYNKEMLAIILSFQYQ